MGEEKLLGSEWGADFQWCAQQNGCINPISSNGNQLSNPSNWNCVLTLLSSTVLALNPASLVAVGKWNGFCFYQDSAEKKKKNVVFQIWKRSCRATRPTLDLLETASSLMKVETEGCCCKGGARLHLYRCVQSISQCPRDCIYMAHLCSLLRKVYVFHRVFKKTYHCAVLLWLRMWASRPGIKLLLFFNFN